MPSEFFNVNMQYLSIYLDFKNLPLQCSVVFYMQIHTHLYLSTSIFGTIINSIFLNFQNSIVYCGYRGKVLTFACTSPLKLLNLFLGKVFLPAGPQVFQDFLFVFGFK